MISLKGKFSRLLNRRYRSIHEFPIYNWLKCRSETDLSFLLKDAKLHGSELSESLSIKLGDGYLDMITEFFKEFGQTEKYKKELEIKGKIIDCNLQISATGDRFLINRKNMLEAELEQLQKTTIKEDVNEAKKEMAAINKASGFIMNTRKVTTVEYYTQRLLLIE